MCVWGGGGGVGGEEMHAFLSSSSISSFFFYIQLFFYQNNAQKFALLVWNLCAYFLKMANFHSVSVYSCLHSKCRKWRLHENMLISSSVWSFNEQYVVFLCALFCFIKIHAHLVVAVLNCAITDPFSRGCVLTRQPHTGCHRVWLGCEKQPPTLEFQQQ